MDTSFQKVHQIIPDYQGWLLDADIYFFLFQHFLRTLSNLKSELEQNKQLSCKGPTEILEANCWTALGLIEGQSTIIKSVIHMLLKHRHGTSTTPLGSPFLLYLDDTECSPVLSLTFPWHTLCCVLILLLVTRHATDSC